MEQLREDERAQVNALYANGMLEKPDEAVREVTRDFTERRVALLAVYGQQDTDADGDTYYTNEWWKEGAADGPAD